MYLLHRLKGLDPFSLTVVYYVLYNTRDLLVYIDVKSAIKYPVAKCDLGKICCL